MSVNSSRTCLPKVIRSTYEAVASYFKLRRRPLESGLKIYYTRTNLREQSLAQYTALWCDCNGDPNATHRSELIQQQLRKLHADGWLPGTIYFSLVLFIYFTSVSILLYKSRNGFSIFLSIVTCACISQSELAVSSSRRRQASSDVMQRSGKLSSCRPDDTELDSLQRSSSAALNHRKYKPQQLQKPHQQQQEVQMLADHQQKEQNSSPTEGLCEMPVTVQVERPKSDEASPDGDSTSLL
ncbi:hypothetical protein FHG87_001950 [Trinorchestia longiramus]|nr:hypothetical protein FHG87_001950 [Trinorchestia longiramus]